MGVRSVHYIAFRPRLPKGMSRAEALSAIRMAKSRAAQFVGLSEAEALALADRLGQEVQVVHSPQEFDELGPLLPGRLTVVIRDGTVVAAEPL